MSPRNEAKTEGLSPPPPNQKHPLITEMPAKHHLFITMPKRHSPLFVLGVQEIS